MNIPQYSANTTYKYAGERRWDQPTDKKIQWNMLMQTLKNEDTCKLVWVCETQYFWLIAYM